jgi:hypothetical protein
MFLLCFHEFYCKHRIFICSYWNMLLEADWLRLVQYVHQVNTASYNEKTLIWNIFLLQVITKTAVKHKYVSIWTWIREARWAHFYDPSEFLVLMILWTWYESFEVPVGVNMTVLGCDIVWFGRHASKFWKNLLPHVQCRCFWRDNVFGFAVTWGV